MMLSSTSRSTLIFPVEEGRPYSWKMLPSLVSPQGPQNFLKAPLRGNLRCAHGAARTERPPVSTDRARTSKSPIFSMFPSQILQNRNDGLSWHAVACVACLSDELAVGLAQLQVGVAVAELAVGVEPLVQADRVVALLLAPCKEYCGSNTPILRGTGRPPADHTPILHGPQPAAGRQYSILRGSHGAILQYSILHLFEQKSRFFRAPPPGKK